MSTDPSGRNVPSGAGFPATRWSLVQLASGADGPALERLCQAYWFPLYAFARRSGKTPEDAEDLTQGFFQKLLEKDWLSDVDRDKGKLRTYLLTAFRRYSTNDWRNNHTEKRGGEWKQVSLETPDGEQRYAIAKADTPPEELFDRQWAMSILERTLAELQREYATLGKVSHFEQLKEVLMLDKSAMDYAALARKLAMSDGAARVAVHRLRKRFRSKFREEVSLTLDQNEDLEAELMYLARTLTQ